MNTITVYYGQDSYIVNEIEWTDYQKQGFTKKPGKVKDDDIEAKAQAEAEAQAAKEQAEADAKAKVDGK
jgi:hypothetical protein